jgi:hypothetical protein
LQDRAREGCSEAAVHAVKINVQIGGEYLEIRERGARTRDTRLATHARTLEVKAAVRIVVLVVVLLLLLLPLLL